MFYSENQCDLLAPAETWYERELLQTKERGVGQVHTVGTRTPMGTGAGKRGPGKRRGPSAHSGHPDPYGDRCRETGPRTGRGSQGLSSSFPSCFPGPPHLFSLLQMMISEPAALAPFSLFSCRPTFPPTCQLLQGHSGLPANTATPQPSSWSLPCP